MSAEAAMAVESWTVGKYRCTLTLQRPKAGALTSAVIEWTPDVPRRLNEQEFAEYRRGRNAALQRVAARMGISVGVLEV